MWLDSIPQFTAAQVKKIYCIRFEGFISGLDWFLSRFIKKLWVWLKPVKNLPWNTLPTPLWCSTTHLACKQAETLLITLLREPNNNETKLKTLETFRIYELNIEILLLNGYESKLEIFCFKLFFNFCNKRKKQFFFLIYLYSIIFTKFYHDKVGF